MEVKIIRELKGFTGNACLVRKGNKYFVVSSVNSAFDTGQPETLVFPADENGKVTSWGDVCGGRFVTRDEAIEELSNLN